MAADYAHGVSMATELQPAHWTQGLTTACMKGLNSLFSAVKRKARGYRSVEYMTTTLYFVAGKLTLPYY